VLEAIRVAREGIRKGKRHFMLVALYGEAVLGSGAEPGVRDFGEARTALEQAVAGQPGYASAQIALARFYLLEDRLDKAITHFELARELDPQNPAVYSYLARALRKRGETARAEEMLAVLSRLNQENPESADFLKKSDFMLGSNRNKPLIKQD